MKTFFATTNRNRVWVILILGLALLLSSSVIYALTLNGVNSSWSNAVGGGGAPTCLTTTTVGSEAQVRYGDDDFNAGCPASPNVQSGFGFDGNTSTSFTDGQPFVLGELTHYNNPIFASSLLESVDLTLNVDLADPLYNAALTTTVTLDETANNLSSCPYGGGQPCSDRVSINLQSTQFSVAGTNYQLEIMGLIPGQMGSCTYNASQIKGSFISAENAANSACIFGRLTPVDDAELVINKQANVTQVHPGDIIDYQIDYNCFSTTTFCSAPVLTDYLPDEVIYTGSTGSTHTVGSTGIYSSGNNSVTFQFIDPLPAGSTGFVRIRVRVRDDGTVGDGQSIDNLAVSTLGNGPTSTTTNSIPAIAASNWDVVKTAPTIVYLDTDRPTTDNLYTVGICSNGSDVNLLGAQMVDTLPTNAVFVSASGGGVYTAGPPGTVTWNLGDLAASSGCTYQTVTVRYPNPPFTVAQNVVNTVDGSGTMVGGTPWTDTANVTNPLAQLVHNPTVAMSKSPGRSGYIIGSRAEFLLSPRNTGNVALDGFTVTDTLPAQIDLTQITVGSFDNYAGSIIVRYERSDNPGVWNVWPGGPFPDDNRTLDVSALGLPGGVYITKIQWDYGTVIPGFAPSGGGAGRIQLYGTVISPDHDGNTVTVGSIITNTAVLDWHYTPSTGGPGTGGNSIGSATLYVDAIPNPVLDKISGGGINAASRFLIGQQVGYYSLTFNNNTGIAVDNFTISDPVPAQYNVTSVTVGSYDNFSGTVSIGYQRSDNPGVWNVWPGSPFTPSNQTLNVSALGLPGGVYITNLEWGFGTVGVDFRTNVAPRINGAVINPDHNGAAVNDGDTMSNTAQMSWDYQSVPNQATDTQNDIVRKPVANPSVQKSTTSSGPYIPTSAVTYALRVGAASTSPSVLINPIVMELLPTNLNYVAGSWVYNAGGSGVAAPTFEQIANYNGTGRTLLRWRFTGNFPQNQFATISFNTTISAGATQGSLTNDYYVTSNDVDINGTTTDVNDLDGDSQTNDTLIGASTTIPVDQLVGLDSFKGVRGELDSGYSVYPASGLTIPSGRVDYRLTIINRGNIPVNNVKVIDILPFVGDTGVQDTHARNSAWRPLLTGAVAAPAGVTVYYSTASNPCRPQIIPSGPAGCTAPNWSLLPPADITTVYSLRFDFSGNLAPGQSFVFNWTMKAPPDAVDGTIAWNSFAYTSTNSVTGVPLRPAEPNKVGIAMSRPVVAPLIDLVKSTNGDDANLPTGPLIQVGDPVTWTYLITNTGNTRLSNVTLTDDILGAITCNEGVIPALNPNDTFTCTVNGVATLNQYANIGTVTGQPVDSFDAPLTDINGIVLPPVTDIDPSHYFGYTPTLARLGDFVWIDSDADGVQDAGEPGLGGVTVNLYQNGNPTAIATTLTDGTGFYNFLNLTADDYFVEFVIPSTYTFTAQDQGGDDTLDSDADTTTGRTAVTTLTSGEYDPTWDAGVLPSASIGDFVWRDADGNNMQNGVEPGVASVQVDLLNSVGAVIATTYTDPAGFYSFTDLVPGDYAVHFTLPTGYLFSIQDQGGNDTIDSDADISTGRTINTTLSPGENDPTWDAGLVQVASIGDRVWRDNNNNGQQDAGEPGVSGITVHLLDSGGTVVATKITDVNGNYLFNNLRPGDYAVEVVLPAGYVFSSKDVGNNNSDSDIDTTTGRTINTTLSPAENDLTWDAGLVPLASIGDLVWNDQNNNGQQDGGEPGFSGVTVNLLDSTGMVIATKITDVNGNYLFDNLLPGDYAVEVVRPPGYVFSPLDSGANASDSDVNRTTGRTVNTTLSPGENDLTWDGGLVQDASIGNYVWSDTNDNGIEDGGEPAVSGITVRLLDNAGNVVSTTTTDGSGLYLFDFLTPADYAVEFVAPTGYSMARRDQGGNDAADSDPNRFTGRTINTTLSPGEDDMTWDAGLVLSASIGDFVWRDDNQNGLQDGGEPGVGGVTVLLLDSSGTVVLTTTTNGSGAYLFDPVPPDDYRVEVVLPAGYVFTLPDQGADAADSDVDITTARTMLTTLSPDEDDMTWDAGLISVASIGDKVWRDNDNDGLQDGGEPGVSGVTVWLLDGGGALVSSTTTDTNGNYAFTNLRPGDYSIQVVLPAGYQFSPQDAAAATDASDSDVNITTGKTINTTLDPNEADMTWDAGIVPLTSIGDRVWIDANDNGIQDGGELGVSGVTVNLLNSGGTVINTTLTDVTGNYSFTNLPPATYAIEFMPPAGYVIAKLDQGGNDAADSDASLTTGRTINTTLDPGENDLTWDAGLVQVASIGDRVWIDINNNGVQDGAETGLVGVTVRLLDNSGGAILSTKITDASGNYLFDNLRPGIYSVQVALPAGYQFGPQDVAAATDATDSDVNITTGKTVNTTLTPGQNDLTWDAGVVPLASIGDFVWRDNDSNGVQDAGEPGVGGVTVRLLDSTNAIISTTTTSAAGNYSFTNLPPGDYRIEVVLPTGYSFSPQDAAAATDAADSDVNTTTGRAVTTTLIPDEDDMTWDAGLIPLGSIGDTVWLDSNHNGVQDGGEAGIPNVTVTLEWPTGVIQTTVTDSNGHYLFDNLPQGTYTVTVDLTTLPPGLEQTYDLDGVLDSSSTLTIAPGEDLLTVDFGYAPPVASAALNATLQPTPEVTPTGQPGQPWTPVTACERKCVNWQLYHTNETGDWEIFRLGNLDDRTAVSPNLSQGEGADDIAPTRSPNAEWIVFSSNRGGNWELYVAPTDGDSSKTRRITHNTIAIDTDPVWGPNNYVVYETTRDGNWELYILDMTTGVEIRLTDNPADDINAFWSPDGTKLLFQSDRRGKWQIYEIDLRTGSISGLSDGRANDVDPQYNNAGDRITFRSYRDGDGKNSVIYTMDADGRNIMRISDAVGDATSQSWSPDDSLIAYQSNLDGDLDIYVYDTSTGKTRQMTDNNVPDYAPTWLCNTTQLIFTSDVSGNPDLFNAEALPIEAPAIKVETAATQLTFDPADDIYPENSPTEENASREGRLPGFEQSLGEQTDFLQPDFSVTKPDVSTETPEDWQSINSCETVCPSWSLYHSDRTGDGEIFRLDDQSTDADSLDLSLGVGANDFGPTRAPNAQWIAFTSDRDGNNEIYIAASDGSSQFRATYNPADDTDPAWSPDSQRIVYESNRDGNWNLYLADVQTGVEQRISDDPADDRNASWSSAGGKIPFESNRDGGTWQIYVYDLATGETIRLTSSDQNARSPVYGNGGSVIAFTLEQADGKSVVEIMQEDGSKLQAISDPGGDAQNPAWYFDDTLLAYQSDLDGDLDIYVYDFASGQTRKLTNNSVPDYAPTWQCGKPAVTFTSDVTGNPDLFRVDALPIDTAPVDLQTDAEQLTQNPAADRDPVGAPTEENASREE